MLTEEAVSGPAEPEIVQTMRHVVGACCGDWRLFGPRVGGSARVSGAVTNVVTHAFHSMSVSAYADGGTELRMTFGPSELALVALPEMASPEADC